MGLSPWQILTAGGVPLFSIGDRVVYPLHGAGIIESIEEREVLGEKQVYYIMKLPLGEMKVMIPLSQVNEAGLRDVIDAATVDQVLEALSGQSSAMSANWNHRYRENMDKIRSGNVFEVAEVVRNLTQRDREKGISSGERKMLDSARQILMSELVLARGVSEAQVAALLERVLG